MARPSPHTWTALFDRAIEDEIGIAFSVSGVSREYFKFTLNESRRLSGDPRYKELVIFMPAAPFDNEFWICKKTVELDP